MALSSVVGCTRPRTEIVVIIRTDGTLGAAPNLLRSVDVRVRRGGSQGTPEQARQFNVGAGANRRALPFTVGILPQEDDLDANRPVWIEARACRADGACERMNAIAVQDALVRFVPDTTRTLVLTLSAACPPGTCNADQHCFLTPGATCVPASAALTYEHPFDAGPEPDVAVIRDEDIRDEGVPDDGMPGGCDGRVTCGAACVDPQTDRNNCGQCGRSCQPEQVCAVGRCECPTGGCACDAGLTSCMVECASIQTNPQHCGRCGRRCSLGFECRSGVCVSSAMIGQRSCASSGMVGCGMIELPEPTESNLAFSMGDPFAPVAAEDGSLLGTRPLQGPITLGSYALDQYEVTVARFRAFKMATTARPLTFPMQIRYPNGRMMPVLGMRDPYASDRADGGTMGDTSACNYLVGTRDGGVSLGDTLPMNCINWETAQAFCVWDADQPSTSFSTGRLPTEAEWEFAARNGDEMPRRRWPWENIAPSPTCDRAQWNGCSGVSGSGTQPVARFPPAPLQFYGFAGNVAEFVADWFQPYGPTDSGPGCWNNGPQRNPLCEIQGTSPEHHFRGGSYIDSDVVFLLTATRDGHNIPSWSRPTIGFRCARSTAP